MLNLDSLNLACSTNLTEICFDAGKNRPDLFPRPDPDRSDQQYGDDDSLERIIGLRGNLRPLLGALVVDPPEVMEQEHAGKQHKRVCGACVNCSNAGNKKACRCGVVLDKVRDKGVWNVVIDWWYIFL
jgi:hypothetical protein